MGTAIDLYYRFDVAFAAAELPLGPGITLVGEGGLVVAAGSWCGAVSVSDQSDRPPGGRSTRYEWEADHSIEDVQRPPAPQWLIAAALTATRTAVKAPTAHAPIFRRG